jgi:hypothetical protein
MPTTTIPAWFAKPDLVPDEDIAEARVALATDDTATFDWRMKNYSLWRAGYAGGVGAWLVNYITGHDEAVAQALRLCQCLHTWVMDGSYDTTNHYLGTYDRGDIKRCTKCGTTQHERRSYNNWSGD